MLEQTNTACSKIIEKNRKNIPVIKTLIYWAIYYIAIPGKSIVGNFVDLLKYWVDTISLILFEIYTAKTKYVSHTIQNQIIRVCADVIRNGIIFCINESYVFSFLGDETSDICGKEWLSIQYFNIQRFEFKEEFLGFSKVQNLNAEGIAYIQ